MLLLKLAFMGIIAPVIASARFNMGMTAAALDKREPAIDVAMEGTAVAVGTIDIMDIIEDDMAMVIEGAEAGGAMEAMEDIEDMAGIEEVEFCCSRYEVSVGNSILVVKG